MVMNNRLAQQAIRQAATKVKSGVQQGAESFVEREVAPLRTRIDELEARVNELERRLAARDDRPGTGSTR